MLADLLSVDVSKLFRSSMSCSPLANIPLLSDLLAISFFLLPLSLPHPVSWDAQKFQQILTSPLRHCNRNLRIHQALPPSRDFCCVSAVKVVSCRKRAASSGSLSAGSKLFDQEGWRLEKGGRGRVDFVGGRRFGGWHFFGPFREGRIGKGGGKVGLGRGSLWRGSARHGRQVNNAVNRVSPKENTRLTRLIPRYLEFHSMSHVPI